MKAAVVRKTKLACLAAYSDGAMRCADCGYANVDALVIDHVLHDGPEHRRRVGGGYAIYYDLKRRNFPPGFRVLCMNCNWLREVARRTAEGRSRKKHET